MRGLNCHLTKSCEGWENVKVLHIVNIHLIKNKELPPF